MSDISNEVDSILKAMSKRIRDPSDLLNTENRHRKWSKYGFVCHPTDRNIEQIADHHDLSYSDFLSLVVDKVVLDIGGGKSHVGNRLADAGIASTVVNLDMASAFGSDEKAEMFPLKMHKPENEQSVIAYAESMPFASETFDTILATYSVPFYSDTAGDFESVLNETLRVLKVGGTARFYPIIGGSGFIGDHDLGSRIKLFGMIRTLSNMPQLEMDYTKDTDVLRIDKKEPIFDI